MILLVLMLPVACLPSRVQRRLGWERTVGRKLCKNEVNYSLQWILAQYSAQYKSSKQRALGTAKICPLLLFHICLIIKYLTARVNHLLISHHLGLWRWKIEEEKYGENLFVWNFFKVNRRLWGIQTSSSKVIRKNKDRCILRIQMMVNRRCSGRTGTDTWS